MKINKKHLTITVFIFVLISIGVIISISSLLTPADKTTGNFILGKFNPEEFRIKTVGDVIKKDTNEIITKRTYNSQTYANPNNSYTTMIRGL